MLINKLCAKLSITDIKKVAYLITKVVDERKERERVDIIFNYSMLANKAQPKVRTYYIKVNSSNLIVKDYFNFIIKLIVNLVVGLFRSQNFKKGLAFPSRTDVRRRRLGIRPI
jgi:hypothetical protein